MSEVPLYRGKGGAGAGLPVRCSCGVTHRIFEKLCTCNAAQLTLCKDINSIHSIPTTSGHAGILSAEVPQALLMLVYLACRYIQPSY